MNATTLNRRQAMTAVAGAAFLTGGASCALIPAMAGADPFLNALAAYKAMGPELNAADDAAFEADRAAHAAYPDRPVWPIYVGKNGPEREVFPGDLNENGEPYRFNPLPETVEEFWEIRNASRAHWIARAEPAPEVIVEWEARDAALARKIEAWQAERARIDAACGVPETDARLDAVETRLCQLYDTMTDTRATTAAGILARLEFFRDDQQGNGECCSDTLDAIVADVRCMVGGVA